MKTGLVLEGGGMRGLFSAGVIDVMMEQGLTFDGLIGVSAGSSFGCNYKSHQPGRVLRYNLKYCKDSRYMGWKTLLRTGNLVGADFAYHVLPSQLDVFDSKTFERDPMEFYLVCTDVDTAEPVYYRMDTVSYESLEWLRASASMPVVTRPVEIGSRRLLDGGISDSIPLEYFKSIGYERNVVVLTQPRDYRKRPVPKWLFKMLLRKCPAIAEAMCRRHEMYNRQLDYIDRQLAKGNTFVIAPECPLAIGRVETDREKMRDVYEQGRNECLRRLTAIKEFLDQ